MESIGYDNAAKDVFQTHRCRSSKRRGRGGPGYKTRRSLSVKHMVIRNSKDKLEKFAICPCAFC